MYLQHIASNPKRSLIVYIEWRTANCAAQSWKFKEFLLCAKFTTTFTEPYKRNSMLILYEAPKAVRELGTIHKVRTHVRGGRGYLKKQVNQYRG